MNDIEYNEVFLPDSNGFSSQNDLTEILHSTNGEVTDVDDANQQDSITEVVAELEQPLQEVPTTPGSYLEYLHVIINCAKLLEQQNLPAESFLSVTNLLTQAKSLFLENACNLLIQTLRALDDAEGRIPKFWFTNFSLHECKIWIELMDSLIFFWSGHESRKPQEKLVMTHAAALVTEIEKLRGIYEPDEPLLNLPSADSLSKLVKDAFELSLISTLVNIKRPTKEFIINELPKLQSILELAELRKSPKLLPWSEITTLFKHITFSNMEQVFSLHFCSQKANDWMYFERIRTFYLQRKAFQMRPRDETKLKAAEIPLFEFLDKWAVYLDGCTKEEKRIQNCKVNDAAVMREFLVQNLRGVVMNRLDAFKVNGSWSQLPSATRMSWEEQVVTRASSCLDVHVHKETVRNGSVESPHDAYTTSFQVTFIPSNQYLKPQLVQLA